MPDRGKTLGIPEGWQQITANEEDYQANFVKIAVNVVARPGTSENVLPMLLREWFGPDAGKPGRTDQVAFEKRGTIYDMLPLRGAAETIGPTIWQRYDRKKAVSSLNITLSGWDSQAGIVRRPGGLVFFVTLEKADLDQAYRYQDQFLSPDVFQWQSQNRTTQASELGQEIRLHGEKAIDVHLFVRREKRIRGRAAEFYYCGTLDFERWEGEKPITVWWRLKQAVPERLWSELKVPQQT